MKTTARIRRILLAASIAAIALIVAALGGEGALRAMEPCRPFQPVQLTGTLVEVRQGEVVIPSEPAILDGVPRFTCVSPTDTNQETTWITAVDCDFPAFSVNVMLAP